MIKRQRFAILLLILSSTASVCVSADTAWLYAPAWMYGVGTPIVGDNHGHPEWVAQPFHVPFDAYASVFGACVGKGSDPGDTGMILRIVDDDAKNGRPGSTTIAEWRVRPIWPNLQWVDIQTDDPILLSADRRYWMIIAPGDGQFSGQVGISGGEHWGLRSEDAGATWLDWGFCAAIRIGGNAVPEPSSAASLLALAASAAVCAVSRRRSRS